MSNRRSFIKLLGLASIAGVAGLPDKSAHSAISTPRNNSNLAPINVTPPPSGLVPHMSRRNMELIKQEGLTVWQYDTFEGSLPGLKTFIAGNWLKIQ